VLQQAYMVNLLLLFRLAADDEAFQQQRIAKMQHYRQALAEQVLKTHTCMHTLSQTHILTHSKIHTNFKISGQEQARTTTCCRARLPPADLWCP